jgi:hypothetical protein
LETRYIVFLFTVGGALAAALVGAAFGGLAGYLTHRDGRAAGSIIGRTVAELFARGDDAVMSTSSKAVLTGAADGAFFLALVGAAVCLVIGLQGNIRPASVLILAVALLALPVMAALFGLLAYRLTSLGVRVIGLVSAASIIGALAGYQLARVDGILLGILAGSGAGTLLGMRFKRRQ